MKFASKIVGIVLIAALMIAPLVTGAWAAADHASASLAQPLAAHAEPPAGCHAHGSTSPHLPPAHSLPVPVSYQCCLTGHDVAVVQASDYTPPSDHWARVTPPIAPATAGCFFVRFQVLKVISADPRGTPPLRI